MQVCVEIVGYLLEELRDAKNYEQFQKDIADANIFIGSLIFIEELAEKVKLAPLKEIAACLLHCAIEYFIVSEKDCINTSIWSADC